MELGFFISWILRCGVISFNFWLKYKFEKRVKDIHWQLIQAYKEDRDWWERYAKLLEKRLKP